MKQMAMLATVCVVLSGVASASISVSGSTTALPWTSTTDVIIGNDAAGGLTVDAGSDLESQWSTIGYNAGGDGSATVTGTGSSWTTSRGIRLGYNASGASGSLTVGDGAVVNSQYSLGVGYTAGATGTLTVDGATLNSTANWLIVGYGGTGTMRIQNGGLVDVTGFVNTSHSTGGQGYIFVGDAGSTLKVSGNMEVARSGGSSVTITNGGLVQVGGTLTIDVKSYGVRMDTGGQLALADVAGTGDDSLADFLALVAEDDDIRYWSGSSWADIAGGTEGVDYTLNAGTGDLAGYAVLTAIPEPATLSLLVIFSAGLLLLRKAQL